MPTYGVTYHRNGASTALRLTAATSGEALDQVTRTLGVGGQLPTHAQGSIWRTGACLMWRNGDDRYGIALLELAKVTAQPLDAANATTPPEPAPVRRRAGKNA
jgi:hypothetical protein